MAKHIYRARHQQQKTLFGGKLIGCTETSLAMAIDGATVGGCRVTESIVRSLSGEWKPDPASPGLSIEQLVVAAGRLHVQFTNRKGGNPTQVRADLDAGRRLVVQLWYADVGGTNIGHAYEVEARRTGQRDRHGHAISGWAWLVNDPIKTKNEWVDEDAMLHAMKTFAVKTGLDSGYRYGCTKIVPALA